MSRRPYPKDLPESFDFAYQLANLKNTLTIWEDVVSETMKLNTALRTVIQCIAGFLEAFQKLADSAYRSNCGLRGLGMSLTKLCLRERRLQSRLRFLNSQLLDCLAVPLADRLKEWRRTVTQLDREHSKERRRALKELQRVTREFKMLNKRFRRKGSFRNHSEPVSEVDTELNTDSSKTRDIVQMNSIQHDLEVKQHALAELERTSLRRAVIEERRRFVELVTCLKPVLDSQAAIYDAVGSIEECIVTILRYTHDPNELSADTEQAIDLAVEQVSSKIQLPERKQSDVRSAMRLWKIASFDGPGNGSGSDFQRYSLSPHTSQRSLQPAISSSTSVSWDAIVTTATAVSTTLIGNRSSSPTHCSYASYNSVKHSSLSPWAVSTTSAFGFGDDSPGLVENGDNPYVDITSLRLHPYDSLVVPYHTASDCCDAFRTVAKSQSILYPNQAVPAPVYTSLRELKRATVRKFDNIQNDSYCNMEPTAYAVNSPNLANDLSSFSPPDVQAANPGLDEGRPNIVYRVSTNSTDGFSNTCVNSGTSTLRRWQSEYRRKCQHITNDNLVTSRPVEYASMTPALAHRMIQLSAPISDPGLHTCPRCALDFRQRQSHVNMVPSPRRVGLRPIEEHQSAHTQPVDQRFRSDTSAPLVESVGTGSCCVTTLSSKTSFSASAAVSFAMTGSSTSASNTSVALTVQHTYVNLVPSITSYRTTADRGPRVVPTCVHIQRPSFIDTVAVGGHDVPIVSSSSHQTIVVSSTTSVNEAQHPEVSELHYAVLTLFTNPDWRRGSSAAQSSSTLSHLVNTTVESTSYLHGVHSVPATIFSDPNKALYPTTEVETCPSEVNYVTIDMFQTKALAEVLDEMSLDSATTSLSPLRHQTDTSRGLLWNHQKRDQPNSSGTSTSTATSKPKMGTQHTTGDVSLSRVRTKRDSLSSLSRIRSYLTHHLQPSSAFRHFARPRPAASRNTTNTTPCIFVRNSVHTQCSNQNAHPVISS